MLKKATETNLTAAPIIVDPQVPAATLGRHNRSDLANIGRRSIQGGSLGLHTKSDPHGRSVDVAGAPPPHNPDRGMSGKGEPFIERLSGMSKTNAWGRYLHQGSIATRRKANY